jgi:leader peptidase (prepilin peptidase) / N-methyltransferase
MHRWLRCALRCLRTPDTGWVPSLVLAVFLIGAACAASGWTAALPAWLWVAAVLIVLTRTDLAEHRLPDRVLLIGYAGGGACLTMAALVDGEPGRLVRTGGAALSAFAGMLGLAVVVAPRLGLGDVKLAGLLGGYLGWLGWEEVVTGLAAGFLLGSAVGVWAVVRRSGGWRTEIAFGPALMVGALAVAARHGPV